MNHRLYTGQSHDAPMNGVKGQTIVSLIPSFRQPTLGISGGSEFWVFLSA